MSPRPTGEVGRIRVGPGWRAALRPLALAWALPNTIPGLILVALALLTGGRVTPVHGVLEVCGGLIARMFDRGPLARARVAAVTLGHVVLAPNPLVLDQSRAHERTHVRQCERWGPLFLPAYAAASIWAMLRGRDPYRDNLFEREAMAVSEEGK